MQECFWMWCTLPSLQSQAEYDVLMKTISEEKARAAERMRELRQEEERISAERDRFHERTAALEQEKQRLEKLALNVRQRSEELDAISEVSVSCVPIT